MNTILRVVIIFALILMCGMAIADILTPNVPETQGFSIQTQMDLLGTATHQDDIVWRISSEAIDANQMYRTNGPENTDVDNEEFGDWVWDGEEFGPENFTYVGDNAGNGWTFPYYPQLPPFGEGYVNEPEPPLHPAGEVQMAVAYNENTIADQGLITYTKNLDIETGYLPINQQNLKATRILTFEGSETGRAISTEDTLMDTVGNSIILREFEPYDCPFAHSLGNCVPPFCNIVESGSSIDMTRTSLASDLGVRSVGLEAYGVDETWPPIPKVDAGPVALDYGVKITGLNQESPALGSVSAYIYAHTQEGGSVCAGSDYKVQDMIYSERTTASGEISLFDKVLSYESGILRN